MIVCLSRYPLQLLLPEISCSWHAQWILVILSQSTSILSPQQPNISLGIMPSSSSHSLRFRGDVANSWAQAQALALNPSAQSLTLDHMTYAIQSERPLHLCGKRCVHRRLWGRNCYGSSSQDKSHCVNRATTAEEPTEKQSSGDTTGNLALGKVSSTSAPRLLSWVSQYKASLYSSLVELGWIF